MFIKYLEKIAVLCNMFSGQPVGNMTHSLRWHHDLKNILEELISTDYNDFRKFGFGNSHLDLHIAKY